MRADLIANAHPLTVRKSTLYISHASVDARIAQHIGQWRAVLNPYVRLHVVLAREGLIAQRAVVGLRSVDGGMVPSVAHGLATDAAAE